MAVATKKSKQAWVYASLTAAALILGGCADKDSATSADDPNADVQTAIEQEATGVDDAATADDVVVTDDVAVATDDVAVVTDDVAVATAEDEVLDGSESEEHVSTY